MRNILLILLSNLILNFVFSQCEGRYQEQIFEDSVVTLQYSDVYDWSILDSCLDMDVYLPKQDTFTNRPLIIFAHGGSFYLGNKNNPEAVAFCKAFAQKGYVTASIQYRLTSQLSLVDSNVMIQTVFNAISDMKSAIRYFKQDVSQNNNVFGIDSSQIFVAGYSAGAITSVNLAFLNNEEEIPAFLQSFVDNAGGLDGDSGNPGFNSKPKAVVSLAGAIYLKSFIDDQDVPIVSLHAQDDETVFYGCNSALGFSFLPILCGSSVIHSEAQSLMINNQLHTFESGGHLAPVSPTNMEEITVPIITDFLYSLLDCNEPTDLKQYSNFDLSIYPNPSTGVFNIQTNEVNYDLKVYNSLGQLVFINKKSNSKNMDLTNLKSGIYSVVLISNNKQVSRKLLLN